MAGYVFYNGFWNPDGPPEVVRSLTAAAAARGAKWVPLPNTAVTAEFTGERRERALRVPPLQAGDYALFWDKDVRLARALEAMGVRLYNTAAAVAVCDDKAATHLELARRGVPMPRTLVAPMTYVNMDAQGDAFLRRGAETLGFPLVVKECFGSLGGQVYLARDRGQLCRLADTMGPKPFLLQQFVAASAGEDKRLYVVGGRVAAAMRRRSETDFRANIGNGGHGGGNRRGGSAAIRDRSPGLRGELQRPLRGADRLHRRGCGGPHRGLCPAAGGINRIVFPPD